MVVLMHSDERRREILRILTESTAPVSASSFAEKFGVTRQIIVKDIALLRAEKSSIISTAKGYMITKNEESGHRKTVYVCHNAEQIEDELVTVVDLGGKVLTTAIEHPFYGTLGETLNIKSRKDIKNFNERLKEIHLYDENNKLTIINYGEIKYQKSILPTTLDLIKVRKLIRNLIEQKTGYKIPISNAQKSIEKTLLK